MKAKCIDNDNNYPLTENKIYYVEPDTQSKDKYWVLNDNGDRIRYFKNRFVIVNDQTKIPIPSKSLAVSKPIANRTEEELRKMLRPSMLPNECPCGTTRSQCEYHK